MNINKPIEIKYIAPSSLVPFIGNPRNNENAIEPVKRSIEHFGFLNPIIARKSDNMIVAGHTRWKAALKADIKQVPVVLVELSENDAKLYNLADNKLGELAEWDIPGLDKMLEDLKALDVDVTLAGFDEIDFDGESGGKENNEHRTLSERFGVPPFSVLDARQGYWQERKKAWLSFGIQSELGRGGGAYNVSKTSDNRKPKLLPQSSG